MLVCCMFLDSHSIVRTNKGVHLKSNNELVTLTSKGKKVSASTQPHTSVSKVDMCNSNIATLWGERSPLERVAYQ